MYDLEECRAVSTVPCTTSTSAPAICTTSARSSARAGTVETAHSTPASLIALMRSLIRRGLTGSRYASLRTALMVALSAAAILSITGRESS